MMLALSIMELKLLLRKKLTAFSVVAVPIGLAALMLSGRPTDAVGWADMLARDFLLILMLSVYMVSLMVFTARRQALALKRLRTSALSDWQILFGVLGPVVVVGLALSTAFLVFAVAVDAPAPTDPLLVVAAVVLGVLVATALGVATACLSRSVEATQLTAIPVMTAGLAGTFLVTTSSPALNAVGVAMPLTGPADLLAKGWASAGAVIEDVPVVPLDLASSVLWLTVGAVAFSRLFQWDPRR